MDTCPSIIDQTASRNTHLLVILVTFFGTTYAPHIVEVTIQGGLEWKKTKKTKNFLKHRKRK